MEFPDLDTHTLQPSQVALVILFLKGFFILCTSPTMHSWSTFPTWLTTPAESKKVNTRHVMHVG